MTAYDTWQALQAKMQEELQRHNASILGGSIKTLEQYREELGYIRALRDALNWSKELAKQ